LATPNYGYEKRQKELAKKKKKEEKLKAKSERKTGDGVADDAVDADSETNETSAPGSDAPV
jgi:hypothetical protein